MAETHPVITPTPAQETLVYRPISGLAIVGLVIACVYAVVVVFTTLVALFQGTPFFLPGWTALAPLGGVVLSLLAQWQIRNSEGTRAGAGLARWGLWLSVFTGLGYIAYQNFTGLAITQQANTFLMVKEDEDSGYFPRLMDGSPVEINKAFLLTLPESSRGSINPANETQMSKVHDKDTGPGGKGKLSQFRDYYLIRAIARSGKNTRIEPLGVQSWTFEQGGYIVNRNYRITTPEAVFQVLLPVQSTEGDAGSQRKWFAAFPRMGRPQITYTSLGKGLMELGGSARVFIDKKITSRKEGDVIDAADTTDWNNAVKGAPWKPLEERITGILGGKGGAFDQILLQPTEHLYAWKVRDQRLQFAVPIQLAFKGPDDAVWTADGELRIECQQPVTVDSSNVPDPQSFPAQPTWKIAASEFHSVKHMAKGPPGGGR